MVPMFVSGQDGYRFTINVKLRQRLLNKVKISRINENILLRFIVFDYVSKIVHTNRQRKNLKLAKHELSTNILW